MEIGADGGGKGNEDPATLGILSSLTRAEITCSLCLLSLPAFTLTSRHAHTQHGNIQVSHLIVSSHRSRTENVHKCSGKWKMSNSVHVLLHFPPADSCARVIHSPIHLFLPFCGTHGVLHTDLDTHTKHTYFYPSTPLCQESVSCVVLCHRASALS